MKPIPPSQFISVFMLMKQTGALLHPTGAATTPSMGVGMYSTLQLAEQHRLMEMLTDATNSKYYIFELEIPNPAYEQGKSQDNS